MFSVSATEGLLLTGNTWRMGTYPLVGTLFGYYPNVYRDYLKSLPAERPPDRVRKPSVELPPPATVASTCCNWRRHRQSLLHINATSLLFLHDLSPSDESLHAGYPTVHRVRLGLCLGYRALRQRVVSYCDPGDTPAELQKQEQSPCSSGADRQFLLHESCSTVAARKARRAAFDTHNVATVVLLFSATPALLEC